MSDEYKDKKRSLTYTIKSWVHYKGTLKTHTRETINPFNVTNYEPFDTDRDEWEKEAAYNIIDKLTAAMITEFDSYGITKPAGENGDATGVSFDWNFETIDTKYEIQEQTIVKVPKEVIEFIKGHERSVKNLTNSLMKFKAMPDLVTEYKKSIAYMTTKAMNMRIKYNLVGIDLYTIQ